MIETTKLTINLPPELLDHLCQVSEIKQVSPSSLASEILQCCLKGEGCQTSLADPSKTHWPDRRRHSPTRPQPEEIVADIQRTLEALGDYLPNFSSGGPLAAEVEAIISQVEAEREND